ncbi:MAG: hypothetical protein JSW12_04910 [Deltaproteobacteria bacterium]|nr:MAG: hypothetical protein JSW12_04910 [Deltaproteobacteria bacterium]
MTQKKSTGPDVSDEEVRVLAEDLIRQESTMTMATAGGDVAWAAPVYYVFWKSSFYFFSEPTSRHIQESIKSGQASAANDNKVVAHSSLVSHALSDKLFENQCAAFLV